MSCVDAVPLQDPSRLDAREQAGLPAAVRRAGVPAGQQPARPERTGERPISRAHFASEFPHRAPIRLIAVRPDPPSRVPARGVWPFRMPGKTTIFSPKPTPLFYLPFTRYSSRLFIRA